MWPTRLGGLRSLQAVPGSCPRREARPARRACFARRFSRGCILHRAQYVVIKTAVLWANMCLCVKRVFRDTFSTNTNLSNIRVCKMEQNAHCFIEKPRLHRTILHRLRASRKNVVALFVPYTHFIPLIRINAYDVLFKLLNNQLESGVSARPRSRRNCKLPVDMSA